MTKEIAFSSSSGRVGNDARVWGGDLRVSLCPEQISQNKVCDSKGKTAFPEKHRRANLEVDWKGMNTYFKKCMFLSLAPSVLETEKGNIHLRRKKKSPGCDLANCKTGWG